jgi:hypothetical protein
VIDPQNPSTLYAAADYSSGVQRSNDGGAHFEGVNSGLPDLYIRALSIDPHNTSKLFAGTRSNGVFMSTDGGASWTAINSGLGCFAVESLTYDPLTNTLYASTACGLFAMSFIT